MKTLLKVILLLLLVLAGGHAIANASAEDYGRGEDFQTRYHQDDEIRKMVYVPISHFGEYAPQLTMEHIAETETSSGDSTSSPLLLKSSSNRMKSGAAVCITLHRDKQYDGNAPFYCLLPSEYYIFALRRIIV